MSAPAWLQQDLRLELPNAVRGDGIRLWDSEGREYIDACSGAISVISLGEAVAEKIKRAGGPAAACAENRLNAATPGFEPRGSP